MTAESQSEYCFYSAEEGQSPQIVADAVVRILKTYPWVHSVLDAGCGNGNLVGRLSQEGFKVTGVDTSQSGVSLAKQAWPQSSFWVASVYEDLYAVLGQTFDACIGTEVIEHLYDPRSFVRRTHEILRPGGLLVLSTPYHGYIKNLTLAVTGRLDAHFTALWDGGHIKFWSRKTLTTLLNEAAFETIYFEGVGRVPGLWKSMVLVARRL
jgi:2-polyprenyl-3-methyl-5-hydroxy-6-metoxy-1,4-benzoquinol methylase